MVEKKNDPNQQLTRLADLYFEELLNTSDDELVLEAEQSGELNGLLNVFKEALDKATLTSGKKRLQEAKKVIEARTVRIAAPSKIDLMTPQQANQTLLKAVNDKRITLAARNLGDLSDAEIRAFLRDLEVLGGLED